MKTRKTRVLVLTSSFPRYKNDWWQQAILSIYSNMDKDNYDITVIAPSSPGAKSSEDIEEVHVKRFKYFFPSSLQLLTSGEGVLYSSRKNKFLGKVQIITFVLAETLLVIKTLAKNDFDIIHANWIIPQGIVAIIAKFFFKKPVIITIHGTDIFSLKKFDFLKALSLKYCDICTTNSSATYKAANKIYPSEEIKIIPMGVDVNLFDPKKKDVFWKKEFGENARIILGVGRLIKWKGFEYLVRSFPFVLNKFPEAKLIIIGKGPEEENLKKLALKLNLKIGKNIFFPDHFSANKLPGIYAASDVVVSPSITDFQTGEKEGQGNVVLEARASGVPVIASRSGGLIDTIDGTSTGLLFEERNYKELSEKIIYLLSDKKIWRKFSENGLKYVRKNYSWKKVSKRFGELYEEITKR
ncbi:hypothetical protein A3F00_02460 [Candidatus Daviesbacteria bacterium RIFCSPHIGHO2_12_FULL_37_11]|uniref:Glycosyl transferase family 1 n=1 Tax=Candidatus Daviesbacteria bacterium RIFCSPHIGHO2_12_FULL_37_11 TaxID=1797777 RepID=A0A1F5K8H4_9BACT|nr:MAG: hypothetical protein A2769_01350 [Candidatus Daviesbacteria bacterium RIFCSPHIGHO2_01_FULL_37_27]OGE37243.1 MAG: hypothetical protein A3F00_02460 [Candidatus Daviesbacteria bacterium RIFCSPHIGHO2_12_FULL_37_11]OGE46116.1 MAG: hypothetical protein A3B39_00915 [Candidatus Daviesbacteria bacterium RIFCSPLOWO2_01_FULL_37_10]